MTLCELSGDVLRRELAEMGVVRPATALCAVDRPAPRQAWRRASGKNRPDPIAARDAGLTLVEVLVVLAILGLFTAVAAPQVLKYLGTAKSQTARTQLSNIESALRLYFLETGEYPTVEQGLKALIAAPPQATRWNGPTARRNSREDVIRLAATPRSG
jgi:prepilin-type N-terminal cleavage/methylation domain-containing protein